MADEKGNEEREKGFVVKDRRFTAKKEGEESPQPKVEKREESPREEKPEQDASLPEITFPSLLLSLSTSALIQLGEIQDPVSKQTVKNLSSGQTDHRPHRNAKREDKREPHFRRREIDGEYALRFKAEVCEGCELGGEMA